MTTTTIEQSKRLLELGLDPKTADMFYYEGTDNDWHLEVPEDRDYEDIPAWSLEALLKVMPIVNEGTYTMIGTLDGGAIISHKEITCVAFQESSPLNAAFNMVCWLLEKGYIKKGE